MVRDKVVERRITKDYVDRFDRVELIQPLAHNKYIKQCYDKTQKQGWKLTYISNSAFHICPADGVFRNCADCGALNEDFDINFCMNKLQFISTGALVGRIVDCKKAGLEVKFI